MSKAMTARVRVSAAQNFDRPDPRPLPKRGRAAVRRHETLRRCWRYRRLLMQVRHEGIDDNHMRVYRLNPTEVRVPFSAVPNTKVRETG